MFDESHGKVIWCGEHACVYDYPAIVSDLKLSFTALPSVHPDEFEKAASNFFANILNVPVIDLEVVADCQSVSGIGSSTAKAIAVLQYYLRCVNQRMSLNEIYDLICEFEKTFISDYSGVDAFACLNRGVYLWERNNSSKLCDEFPFDYFIVDTGCEESTADMIDYVSKNKDKQKIFDEMRNATILLKKSLFDQNEKQFHECVNAAGCLLARLGVMSESVIALSEKLKKLGRASKVTGAGGLSSGSGAVIVTGKLDDRVLNVLRDSDFNVVYEYVADG